MNETTSALGLLEEAHKQQRVLEQRQLDERRKELASATDGSSGKPSRSLPAKHLAIVAVVAILVIAGYTAFRNFMAPRTLLSQYEDALAVSNHTVAAESLGRYLELRPEDWTRLAEYGKLLLLTGRFTDARAVYARLIAQSPLARDADTQFLSALSYAPGLKLVSSKSSDLLISLNTHVPALIAHTVLSPDDDYEDNFNIVFEQLDSLQEGQDTYNRYTEMMKLLTSSICFEGGPFAELSLQPEFRHYPNNLTRNDFLIYGIDARLSADFCKLAPRTASQTQAFNPSLKALAHFYHAVAALQKGDIDVATRAIARSIAEQPMAINSLLDGVLLAHTGNFDNAFNSFLRTGVDDNATLLLNQYITLKLQGKSKWLQASETLANASQLQPQHTHIINNLGVESMLEGRYGQAANDLEKALAQHPLYAHAIYNLAIVSLLEGDYENARKRFSSISNQSNLFPGIDYYLGLAFLETEDDSRAVSFLRTAAAAPGFGSLANLVLGDFFGREPIGFSTALEHYQAALNSNPNNFEAAIKQALVKSKLGQPSEALSSLQNHEQRFESLEGSDKQSFQELLNTVKGEILLENELPEAEAVLADAFQNTTDPELYKRAAVLYTSLLLQQGKVREALDVTRTVLPSSPNDIELLVARAEALAAYNDLDEALAILSNAEQVEPENTHILDAKAHILLKDQRWDQAVELFKKVFELNPSDVTPLEEAIAVLDKLGDREREKQELQEQIERNTLSFTKEIEGAQIIAAITDENEIAKIKAEIENITALMEQGEVQMFSGHSYRGFLHNQLGDLAAAIGDYEAATRAESSIDADTYITWQNLANAYIATAQFSKALEAFTSALDRSPPEDFENQLLLARAGVKEKLRLIEEAIDDYSVVLEKFPNFDRAYYRRGLLYLDDNQPNEAIEDLTKAIRINPKYLNAYKARRSAYTMAGDTKKASDDAKTITLLQKE